MLGEEVRWCIANQTSQAKPSLLSPETWDDEFRSAITVACPSYRPAGSPVPDHPVGHIRIDKHILFVRQFQPSNHCGLRKVGRSGYPGGGSRAGWEYQMGSKIFAPDFTEQVSVGMGRVAPGSIPQVSRVRLLRSPLGVHLRLPYKGATFDDCLRC